MRKSQFTLRGLLLTVPLAGVVLAIGKVNFRLAVVIVTPALIGGVCGRLVASRMRGWILGVTYGIYWAALAWIFSSLLPLHATAAELVCVVLGSIYGGVTGGLIDRDSGKKRTSKGDGSR